MGYTIYTSATPGPYEMAHAEQVVEQIIRPTGLVDPEVEVRPTQGQVDDLIGEIKQVRRARRAGTGHHADQAHGRGPVRLPDRNGQSRCTTCIQRSKRLERMGILRDLRLGVFDVVVGINLLREGLDLPEVSLVAILDADKEGFLRSEYGPDPDHRARGAAREGAGDHVRGPHHRRHECGHRRDQRGAGPSR